MKILFIKSAILTILTLALTFVVSNLSETRAFRFIFPELIALDGFDLTDIAFKERTTPEPNDDIVIVNIGKQTRGQIAKQIQIISKYNPKVIGLDSFFDCSTGLRDTLNCPQLKDTLGNLMLSNAIREAGNVILVSRLLQRDTTLPSNIFDSLRRSDAIFYESAKGDGFSNLDTDAAYQDGANTCRSFIPQKEVRGSKEYSFSAKIAVFFDSTKAQRFLNRGNDSELINFRGNVFDIFKSSNYPNVFYTLDVEDVMSESFVPEMIANRIVLFGFLGGYLGEPAFADMHYTPLNHKLAGKANPDMFGVVVHANILAMILNQDYIDELSPFSEFVFALLVCFLHILILLLIAKRIPQVFDVLAIVLIIAQVVIYSYLRLF
ncbi:MAG: hypothetical protein C0490_17280, partial [Marivirga sp.]|nr:hypothetical protein [Marivirga sp.]